MSLSEILKEGFRITNRNWPLVLIHLGGLFLLLFVLFFSFFLPLLISGSFTLLSDFDWEDFLEDPFLFQGAPLLLLLIVPFLFLGLTLLNGFYIFVAGGVKGVYKEDLLQENSQSFTFSRFIQNGKVYFWRIAGLWALLGLIIFPLLILFGIFGGVVVWMMKIGDVEYYSLIFMGILIIFSTLLFTLYFSYSNILLVMEDEGAGGAMRRGLQFLKDHFGPAAGLYLVLVLIHFGISALFTGIQFPFNFIPVVGTLVSLFLLPIQTLLSIYLSLFFTAAMMVFYRDRRGKKPLRVEPEIPLRPI